MKRRFWAAVAVCLMSVLICISSSACDLGTSGKDGSVKKLTPALLDGKVANLLAADGIGIEKRNPSDISPESAQASSMRWVAAAADGAEQERSGQQDRTELVKESRGEVEEVRFHPKKDGSYRDFNRKFGRHHHGGKECLENSCDQPSDELLEEEASENIPTINSLEARVNKLYSTREFTFLNVSAAVEGNVTIATRVYQAGIWDMSTINEYVAGIWPTKLNLENSISAESENLHVWNYIKVDDGSEKKGIIPLRASDSEADYHYSNYWSDDYNQSYLIDNDTGITYSLSAFPYIYSVEEGIIKIFGSEGYSYYLPRISDGELSFDQILRAEEAEEINRAYIVRQSLADRWGNVVLLNCEDPIYKLVNFDEYGEVRISERVIFACNPQNLMPPFVMGRIYRYHKGDDGRIYRFDFRGDLSNMSVSVLNAAGAWEAVNADTQVSFPFAVVIATMELDGGIRATEISDGKLYLSNACDGLLRTSYEALQRQWNLDWCFAGVAVLPVNGGEARDAELSEVNELLLQEFGRIDPFSFYRVGNTCMVYRYRDQIVRWDRKTGERDVLTEYGFSMTPYNQLCFSMGNQWVSYGEESVTAETFSDTPIERAVQYESYYTMLRDKLN